MADRVKINRTCTAKKIGIYVDREKAVSLDFCKLSDCFQALFNDVGNNDLSAIELEAAATEPTTHAGSLFWLAPTAKLEATEQLDLLGGDGSLLHCDATVEDQKQSQLAAPSMNIRTNGQIACLGRLQLGRQGSIVARQLSLGPNSVTHCATDNTLGTLGEGRLLIKAGRYNAISNERLVESGVTANSGAVDAALLVAAASGQTALVQQLLELGAAIEAKGNDGWTALILAAQEGHLGVVERLIEKGASIEAKQKEGRTALMLAAKNGHLGVIERLIALGAAVEAKQENGVTALMLAAFSGHQAVVERLIEKGASIEAKQEDGWTALMLAAHGGHLGVVKQLIACGAQVAVRNAAGNTAEKLALDKGHLEIKEYLRTVSRR